MILTKYLQILRNLYKSKDADIVGLDISADFIKLLKINSSLTPKKVEKFAISPLPKGAFVKDQIKNQEIVSEKLKELFKQHEIKTHNIAIAIPRSSAITKNIKVNSQLTMDEIESRVWIEADRHFSNLIGEIYLDFSIIGPSSEDTNQLDIVLVASRKDQIKPYFEMARLSDLNIKIVDINCYALERALAFTLTQSLQTETIALLNLDYSLMSLLVVNKGNLIYANDQGYDGHRLLTTKPTLVSHAVLTADGEVTQEDSNVNHEDINEAPKEAFISYLRHMMQFFYSSSQNIKIDKMIISGDCAATPNLNHFIGKEIGMETELANPFQNMSLDKAIDVEKLIQYSQALTLCCGLAMSKLK